jgi:hypothetical protein
MDSSASLFVPNFSRTNANPVNIVTDEGNIGLEHGHVWIEICQVWVLAGGALEPASRIGPNLLKS